MILTHRFVLMVWALALLALPPDLQAQEPVRVVTSLSTYAAITREITGDRGAVTSIGQGDENPHYVQPRPSFLVQLQKADLFVTTGLDLELWVPALLDKANNRRINEGSPGYVTTYGGIRLLDVPATTSRSEGDIHVFGNPHIWTDPINGVLIGQNVLAGLKRVSPGDAAYFDQHFASWKEKVVRALVGDEITTLLGSDAVFALARDDKLRAFLESKSYQGKPLVGRLGGWLKIAEAFRGQKMICYHKEWDYFSERFDISCVDYIEPKPGIPPSPRHVADIMNLMREQHIPVLFSTNYYDRHQVETVAQRTGAAAVIVPANTGGAPGTGTYIDLVGTWVRALADPFARSLSRGNRPS
ncbi:MAG: zinc ABC transporter substrate-binding protein [Gemmatimonadetes bacterium]|nr:zinc ABC transporter substrate-binding protein [Gemmatimonadota bacterium]